MPYISNEEVTKKRKAIKAAFPNWKFSITKEHYTSIHVAILEADIELMSHEEMIEHRGYVQVNHYYIHEHYADRPEIMKALQDIADIMKEGKKESSFDGDYGSIPNFYVNLRIGEYSKPFKYVKPEPKFVKPIPVYVDVAPMIQELKEAILGQVQIIDYSEKAIAVIGETKPIKDTLSELGGRFNRFLTYNGEKVVGWVFSKTREQAVRERLNIAKV